MSHFAQGLPFNPMMNNEVFGSLEHTFCNDLKFSQLQPNGRNKFASSINHYSSNCLVPPNCKLSSTAVVSPNLSFPNKIRSAVEFQALSVNQYLPIDKPQSYASVSSFVASSQQPTYCRNDEVGFSSLFSLEYSFSDYRDLGLKNFEQLGSIDKRHKDSCLPPQLKQPMFNEPVNPQELILPRQNLSVHGQPHSLILDQSLPFNAKEMDSFAFSSLIEPACLTNSYKFNNCLFPPFPQTQSSSMDSSPLEEICDQSRSTSSSETNNIVIENSFPGEKQPVLNLTTEKPVSTETHKNCNFDYALSSILSAAVSSDVFKNETENKPDSLPSPNKDIKDVSKETKLDFDVANEKPNIPEFNNCRSDSMLDTKNTSTLPVKENNESKTSSEPATSKVSSNKTFDALKKLQEGKNLNNPLVKDHNKESFSNSSAVATCQPTTKGSPKAGLKFETFNDVLPVECDSTTESSLQQTDLNLITNSLLPNESNTGTPSIEKFESNSSDQSFSEVPAERGSYPLITPSKCRICKEPLFTETPMLQQFTVPIDANFDVCNACNICFLQKSSLSTNSLDEKNQHKCTYCDRHFKKECYLILHMRTHSIDKPFKCSKCKKAFANTAKLKRHFKTHYVEKPFVCHECDRRFVQNSHLKMHMNVHFGNKPYICESCPRSFKSKSRLTEHEKYHSPKLPFKCTTCEKSFVKEAYFESHLRIHCNAKPFECNICKTFFAQKSVLRQHTKNCRNSKEDSKLVLDQSLMTLNTQG